MSARDLLHDLLAAGFTLKSDGGRLLVTPASALTLDKREALRACKPELLALLAGTDRADDYQHVVGQRCADCRQLTRVNACRDPIAAGLLTEAEGYGIAWPPAGHAEKCAAFSGKAPSKPTARPYRLSPAQDDAAHAVAWDDAAIARFQARVMRLVQLGIAADHTDDLAERLHLRGVEGDDRVLCVECRHHRPGRCGNQHAAGLHSPELALNLAVMLQDCQGFNDQIDR